MASSYIYKPGTTKGPVFLAPDNTNRGQAPTITFSNGQSVTGKYYNTNEGRHQFVFPSSVLGQTGAKLNYGDQSVDIGDTNTSYEGMNINDGWEARAKGSIGSGGAQTGGGLFLPPGATGGGSTLSTANPFYIGGNFPKFNPVDWTNVNFPNITTAPFEKTGPVDITKFAEDFAKTNTAGLKNNFNLSSDFALRALDNELQGLKNFVPGAADLSRGEIAKDNPFNQGERTAQIDATLPNLRRDLTAQGDRARTYASGQLPSDQLDRALELGIRSRAGDRAAFSGFGSGSLASSKISDLMSAEERFKIAQYGEGLTTNNAQTRAALELAPTEYSQAGSQVKVTPEVGAGRLTYQGLEIANQSTLLSPGQALTGEFQNRQNSIQQNEFTTSLENSNRQFNANGTFNASTINSTNQLQADEFNSAGQFTADLGKFNYDVSYLNALQTANQGTLNTVLNTQIAGINAGNTNAGISAGQNANTIGAATQAIGAVTGAIGGVANILGNSGSTAPTTNTQTNVPQNAVGGAAGTAGSGSANLVPSGGANTGGTGQTSGSGTVDLGGAPSGGGVVSGSLGPDATMASGLKFSPNTVPQGYATVSHNGDGTVSAVPRNESSLAEFARFARVPSSSVDVGSIARADQALSQTAALSYVPIQGFQPIALTATGKSVYSLPAAASNGNANIGRDSVENAARTMVHLGTADERTLGVMDKVAGDASNPELHAALDRVAETNGPEAVGKALANRLREFGVNARTPEGQQALAGAKRIGEVWTGLSPAQKSLAITSLTTPLVVGATGKNPANGIIPGTEKSITGPLRVKDVIDITQKGGNGFGLARNWNDISAISNIVADTTDVRGAAQVASKIGLAGFGPSGSAVPLESKYLTKVGATPAPAFGVGAAKFKSPKTVPSSYEVITSTADGHTIAVPKNLKSTTPFAKNNIHPLVYKKGEEIAAGRHPAQKLWKGSPSGKVVRNSIGGSAIVSGLDTMQQTNPTMFSAVAAHATFNNLIGGV